MCSTPRGRKASQPRTQVNAMCGDMSAADYSDMVRRANESYERRQRELAEIRAGKPRNRQAGLVVKSGIFERLRKLLLASIH